MAKVGLYGGGFKPPTKGHFEVVKQALENNPDLDSLIVIVGQKERGGVDQSDSLVIWDMYLKYLPLKVEILPVATPIRTIYNIAKENPQNEYKWFLGKRVFPRWKIINLIIIGVWVGYMIDYNAIFAIIFGLLMAWDLTKK